MRDWGGWHEIRSNRGRLKKMFSRRGVHVCRLQTEAERGARWSMPVGEEFLRLAFIQPAKQWIPELLILFEPII